MSLNPLTLNELPVANRNRGHAINIVDVVKNICSRRLGVLAKRIPQIHTVDRS